MYVILTSIQNVIIDGNVQRCLPGDWVDVGRSTALRWVEEGSARLPQRDAVEGWWHGCGLVTDDPDAAIGHLKLEGLESVAWGKMERRIPYPKTVYWVRDLAIQRSYLIPLGLELLDRWQVAAPLHDFERLALDFGDEEDQQATLEELGDLRVMVYDTRLLFVRRCLDTEHLLELWDDERDRAPHRDLAFLRALNRTCPLVLALPPSWRGEGAPA